MGRRGGRGGGYCLIKAWIRVGSHRAKVSEEAKIFLDV